MASFQVRGREALKLPRVSDFFSWFFSPGGQTVAGNIPRKSTGGLWIFVLREFYTTCDIKSHRNKNCLIFVFLVPHRIPGIQQRLTRSIH